jgi:heme/copper-type cytochrome/quinol oxidase subunit 2
VLLTLIASERSAISTLTNFFFNHFTAALVTLFVLGVLTTGLAYRAFRRTETAAAESLTQLLVTVSLSALLSVAFLALFVLAAALPLYSRLTER